jgi:hypothetical protein
MALFFVEYRRRLEGMLEEACHWETYKHTVLHARQLLQALLLAIGFDTLEAAEAVYPFILVEHIESWLRYLEDEARYLEDEARYLEDEARYLEDEAHDDEDDDDVTVACATDDDSDDSPAQY